jgi:ANTAR domain/GAF domain
VTDSRLGKIWELVAEQAASHATGLSAADACAAAVAGVQVTGGWLNAGADGTGGHLMQATDEAGRYLADLQLTLGEGPSFDAYSAGGPALASDLADEESARRWPTFASAACQAGAAAVFAFPLVVGAIRAGVLSLYRDRPGALSPRQLGDALLFADTATLLLLNAQANGSPAAKTNGEPADFAGHRVEIDQATGMLTEQLGVNITDAFARLRAYAYANDLRLADVARDIVARRLRLHPGSGPSSDIVA